MESKIPLSEAISRFLDQADRLKKNRITHRTLTMFKNLLTYPKNLPDETFKKI